ncbi:ABC transporter related [Acidimicrobium ferrooxidans DSM 10331]|uniref:ABC transporter related n=1 Tax=Acidimicrobium ferrooxidans (strain DSM 10331 / JCM 15462 / NBRC 103882 / ICP) TaxID=525909 RepID=C7M0I8_ACIFD|nr:ATP-binding cassette domain-containing protein [Acidimicrobium ferrooxidans]ACU54496.1 ABC transporter related [Acidimicrobium ferrooxidans DSM 10331]
MTQAVSGALLELRGVEKNFGAVKALEHVDLTVVPGKVTALVGDNGAGKSTLIKVISGIHRIDGGEILIDGQRVDIHDPRDAERLGITTVYQDLALCDNLDIVQNMFLGREPRRRGILDEATMEQKVRSTLAGLSVVTVRSIRQPVGSLSGGQRQAVAVARAVLWNSRVVLFDEPTAALGVSQTRVVLGIIRDLAASGMSVILISHNLQDVFSTADRIAILHLGRMVAQGDRAEFEPGRVVELMTGQSLESGAPRGAKEASV